MGETGFNVREIITIKIVLTGEPAVQRRPVSFLVYQSGCKEPIPAEQWADDKAEDSIFGRLYPISRQLLVYLIELLIEPAGA